MGDDAKVGLLQVLQTWELFVEVLSQVEDLLGHIEDLVLVHSADLDQSGDHLSVDQVLLLQLLADLQGHVDGADSQEAWVSAGELKVMHGHFGEVDGHLFD